jgi:GTP-sensing pleiotropic transcriptional regulator CodY
MVGRVPACLIDLVNAVRKFMRRGVSDSNSLRLSGLVVRDDIIDVRSSRKKGDW